MINLSITGADNKVDVNQLKDFALANKHVELGILYFLEKQVVVRNPDFEWRKNYLKSIPKEQTAFHLCGGEAFWNILADNFEKTTNSLLLMRVNANVLFRGNQFQVNHYVLQWY